LRLYLPTSRLAKPAWFFLFLVIVAFYFYALGSFPLIGPDEPRYAEVAREMLARHDLITPTLGGMPWFEKPPLLYWMMMGSYRVFGVTEFAARFGPAICGLVTALFVWWIAVTMVTADAESSSRKGLSHEGDGSTPASLPRWSTLVLLSSIGMMVYSRAASYDIVLTMTLTGAFAFFLVWEIRSASVPADGMQASLPVRNRSGNSLLVGFYFFIGLSLLAKGLIGVIVPVCVIGLYFVLRRTWPPPAFLMSLFWGLPLAIGTALLWYGPMITRYGWTFVDRFILEHHFARFFTNKYHHPGPFYYYLLTLPWLVLPWTVVLISACISARFWSWRGQTPVDRFRVFAFAWLVAPVAFFSLSDSKLPAYILPVVPAAALLIGEHLAKPPVPVKIIRVTGVLLLILAVSGIWYVSHAFPISFPCAFGIALGAIMVGAFALLASHWRKIALPLFVLTTLTAGVVGFNCGAAAVAQRESVRDLLRIASEKGYGATPVVQLFTDQRTAEFYAAGRLMYRPDGEPMVFEGATQVADAARRSGGTVLCLVPKQYEAELLLYRDVRVEELANNGRVALLVVQLR
jgi:4-amino-4-deoxy-L-arabinose transferase-like glycosyltransferase